MAIPKPNTIGERYIGSGAEFYTRPDGSRTFAFPCYGGLKLVVLDFGEGVRFDPKVTPPVTLQRRPTALDLKTIEQPTYFEIDGYPFRYAVFLMHLPPGKSEWINSTFLVPPAEEEREWEINRASELRDKEGNASTPS